MTKIQICSTSTEDRFSCFLFYTDLKLLVILVVKLSTLGWVLGAWLESQHAVDSLSASGVSTRSSLKPRRTGSI